MTDFSYLCVCFFFFHSNKNNISNQRYDGNFQEPPDTTNLSVNAKHRLRINPTPTPKKWRNLRPTMSKMLNISYIKLNWPKKKERKKTASARAQGERLQVSIFHSSVIIISSVEIYDFLFTRLQARFSLRRTNFSCVIVSYQFSIWMAVFFLLSIVWLLLLAFVRARVCVLFGDFVHSIYIDNLYL